MRRPACRPRGRRRPERRSRTRRSDSPSRRRRRSLQAAAAGITAWTSARMRHRLTTRQCRGVPGIARLPMARTPTPSVRWTALAEVTRSRQATHTTARRWSTTAAALRMDADPATRTRPTGTTRRRAARRRRQHMPIMAARARSSWGPARREGHRAVTGELRRLTHGTAERWTYGELRRLRAMGGAATAPRRPTAGTPRKATGESRRLRRAMGVVHSPVMAADRTRAAALPRARGGGHRLRRAATAASL